MTGISERLGEIARRVLGPPNKAHSSRSQLRFGSNGSLAVDINGSKAGTWYDHEISQGGGWREFLRIKGGVADNDIDDWLEREGFAPNGKADVPEFKIVAAYDYRAEDGALLFQVCRLYPKTFRQRRPHGTGWEWTTKGTRMVPYALPALRAAASTANGTPWRVYIVEGEKDADRLAQWGLTATTNPGGAGKWRDEYAQFFSGADAVVIPDNDDAGRQHAQAVAQSIAPRAAAVRILELPGLPEKGDISEWLDGGASQSDLETLLELCPAFQPEPPKAKRERARPSNGADLGVGPMVKDTNVSVSLDDFYAYMPSHCYIYIPTREMWPSASINARIPPAQIAGSSDGKTISASSWLDRNRSVEQMTWAPGEPLVINDRLVSHGGWIEQSGVRCFNLYRPSVMKQGDPSRAGPWLDHVRSIYPDGADHILTWLAHRVQRPGEKINHALVLGGAQGIGKDTILEPVKHAVGPWNFREIDPQRLLGRFNGFLKSVILRISEARDLGEVNRYQFYDHSKAYTASPPDVLLVDEKHLREHSVLNCCGVIITTNHKTDGLYLPEDDRRHFVEWSERNKEEFGEGYWTDLYNWYERGGIEHVCAYLAAFNLSGFNPKAPPTKTTAFWEIVHASRAPEDAELADALDLLGNPDIVTVSQIVGRAPEDFASWLKERKNSRLIPHRLEACGYVAVRNPHPKDGLWVVNGKRQVIYGKATVTQRDRVAAALHATGAR